MSIVIQGVSMPPKGKRLYVAVNGWGDVYLITSAAEIIAKYQPSAKAVELPPHGRLGDLDALERNLREMADYQHGDRQQGILGCCSTICSAHTIIPADPEDKEEGR